MKFKESQMAHKYLDGLTGLEIGGGAHNTFGLMTKNVDKNLYDTFYQKQQIEMCGEYLHVDYEAEGDNLKFAPDKSFDFIISSHVIEHFFDPINTLKEWARVAKKYIYIICPHKDRTFDKDRQITTLEEIQGIHSGKITKADMAKKHNDPNYLKDDHRFIHHFTVWNTKSFIDVVSSFGFKVVDFQDFDDKVGNGFTIVIDLEQSNV